MNCIEQHNEISAQHESQFLPFQVFALENVFKS